MWGQKDVAILSGGGTVFITQQRMSGREGREPGINRERITKGKGGSS